LLHDLKHPIDNIIRITRRLSSHTKDDELKKFSRELLEQESKNIHSFISKIKEPLLDSLRFRQPKTSINQVLRNSCKAFQKKFEDKEIKVKMELSRSELFIEGDPFDFERIIKNLIVNAIDAMEAMEGMKDDRFLGFSSKKENGHVMVSISDNGPGIEPERLKTLFTDGSSGKKDGWGIGLSVSKALLEKMGGLIEVESSLGEGATFTLKFKSP
jgi:signal transduction histidine kinase